MGKSVHGGRSRPKEQERVAPPELSPAYAAREPRTPRPPSRLLRKLAATSGRRLSAFSTTTRASWPSCRFPSPDALSRLGSQWLLEAPTTSVAAMGRLRLRHNSYREHKACKREGRYRITRQITSGNCRSSAHDDSRWLGQFGWRRNREYTRGGIMRVQWTIRSVVAALSRAATATSAFSGSIRCIGFQGPVGYQCLALPSWPEKGMRRAGQTERSRPRLLRCIGVSLGSP